MGWNLVGAFRRALERRAQDKARQADYVSAVEAIKQGRAEDLYALCDANDFDRNQERDIVAAAIRSDNTEIFKNVLNRFHSGNPNAKLHFSQDLGPEGPYHSDEYSLLTFAMNHQSYAVALMIAKDPKTDVSAVGQSIYIGSNGGGYFTPGKTFTTETPHHNPLDVARGSGQKELIAAIAERVAEQHTQKAQKLMAEARLMVA